MQYSLKEVKEVLFTIDDVEGNDVFGMPDERFGEKMVGVIVIKKTLN